MTLVRWNPFQELRGLSNELNRVFEPFYREFEPGLGSGSWVPPVDISETAEKLMIRAELPGMKPEDIEVNYENGVLTIRGERTFEQESGDRNYHRVERSYGRFVRSFTLPTSINPDEVVASYKDGVLELEMPKREESKSRKITIGTRAKAIEAEKSA